MNYNSKEETIVLKDFIIAFLRKWYLLLLAAVICAAALGSFEAMQAPKAAMPESEIEGNTAVIEENNKTLESCENLIETGEGDIAYWEILLDNYENMLEEYRQILDLEESPEDRLFILSQISDIENSIVSTQKNISDTKKSIADTRILMLELEEKNQELEEQMSEVVFVSSNSVIQFAIVGAFLGIFLACVILGIQYLLSKHMHTPIELEVRYGLRILGNLSYTPNRRGGWFSKLLDRIEGYQVKEPNTEYGLITSGIEITPDISKDIMISGTAPMEQIKEVCENLNTRLAKENYSLYLGENPVYDAVSMLKLKDCSVLLVESMKKSSKKEIDKLIELIAVSGAKVIGVVVVE